MKRLSRILGGNGRWWFIGGLSLVGHTSLAIQAALGSQFALYIMIPLFYVWTGLAILNGVGRGSSLKGWEHALNGWDETQKLAGDYASLVREACSALATWDREQAGEIIERANTIGRLRQMNFDERNHE